MIVTYDAIPYCGIATIEVNAATLTLITISDDSVIVVTGLLHVESTSGPPPTYAHIVYETGAIIVAANVTIDSGCSLNADGKGHGPGLGTGAGHIGTGSGGGGGGGHAGIGGGGGGTTGGLGGTSYAYNDYSPRPDHIISDYWDGFKGSGGASGAGDNPGTGGYGGGIVRLIVTHDLVLDGTISANGTNGSAGSSGGGGGGGSGGFVAVSACCIKTTLTTGGTITANGAIGGSGTNGGGGGGGGGGYVFVYYSKREIAVPITNSEATNGNPGTGGNPGSGGSAFVQTGSMAEAKFYLNNTPITEVVLLVGGSIVLEVECHYVPLGHFVEAQLVANDPPGIVTLNISKGYSYLGREPASGEYDDCCGLYALSPYPDSVTLERDSVWLECTGLGETTVYMILCGVPDPASLPYLDVQPAGILYCINTELHPKAIWFKGDKYWPVLKDADAQKYVNTPSETDPHWLDNNLDGDADDAPDDRKYPICFTRNTKPKVSALFISDVSIPTKYPNLIVRGCSGSIGTIGGGVGVTPQVSQSGTEVRISDVEPVCSFADEVDFLDPLWIWWQVSVDGGVTWHPLSPLTRNRCYVTLGDAIPSPEALEGVFHTCVHIGCKYGDGEDTEAGMLLDVWDYFSKLLVCRADGKELHYYKSYKTLNCGTKDLLGDPNGDGQCGAWAHFFIDVLRAQGIQYANNYAVIEPKATAGSEFFVKRWNFQDPGKSSDPNYPYLNIPDPSFATNSEGLPIFIKDDHYEWKYADVTDDTTGLPGQHNGNPASLFGNHQVYINGTYYDPSMGKTYASLQEIDDQAIAAYAERDYSRQVNESDIGVDLNNDGDTNDQVIVNAYIIKKNPPGLDLDVTLYSQ